MKIWKYGETHLKMLLYGYPGNYKTRTSGTAATHPETSPCLYLNAGGNPVSIRDYDPMPDVVNIEDLKDLNDPFDWIMAGQPEKHYLVTDLGLSPVPYKSVVIDQLTEIQRMTFDVVMGMGRIGPGSIPPKKEWDHFNKVLMMMVNFTRLYYSLPIHVIMIAQEREADPDKGRPTGPLLEGQSFVEVPSHAEIVGRIQSVHTIHPATFSAVAKESGIPKDQIESVVFFASWGSAFLAKDQYGVLGDYMVNPTIPMIMDALRTHSKP